MPLVATEDLIDAVEVARLLGLSQRNSVSNYLKRYSDMPRPVIDLGPNRPRLWLRTDIERWLASRTALRRRKPAQSSSTCSDNNRPPSGGTGVSEGGRKPRAERQNAQGTSRRTKSSS